MRKLGEQWVEELDGKKRMLKLVKGNPTSAKRCSGCAFSNEHKKLCELPGGVFHISEIGCARQFLIIKDLGVLNEDGALPDYHTGKYPTIKDRHEGQGWLGHIWDCIVCEKIGNDDEAIEIRVSALTRQEAIDRWNRRA